MKHKWTGIQNLSTEVEGYKIIDWGKRSLHQFELLFTDTTKLWCNFNMETRVLGKADLIVKQEVNFEFCNTGAAATSSRSLYSVNLSGLKQRS